MHRTTGALEVTGTTGSFSYGDSGSRLAELRKQREFDTFQYLSESYHMPSAAPLACANAPGDGGAEAAAAGS